MLDVLLFPLLALFLCATPLRAATNDLTSLLQQGLFEEEANRNIEAAIASYESLAKQFDKDRQIAATAVFRLGECYRKLGRTNDAVVQYQRIIREFADQQMLVTLSRQNLAGLGSATSAQQIPVARLGEQLEATLNQLRELQTRLPADDPRVKDLERRVAMLSSQIAEAQSVSAVRVPSTPADQIITDEEEKEIRRIQEIIRNSPDLINAAPLPDGWRPLHAAAAKGQLQVARYLLENGAIVDVQNARGETPLILAASSGHKAMVELLLANGADPSIRSRYSPTAMGVAADKGYTAVVEALAAHGADVNEKGDSAPPLHRAASGGHTSTIQMLLSRGADVNLRNANGTTPLHFAAAAGAVGAVRALLDARADINARNDNGETPLLAAVREPRNPNEVALLLLSAGADPNLTTMGDPKNVSVLHYAVAKNDIALTRALLERGANPNISASTRPVLLQNRFGSGGDGPPLVTACLNTKNPEILQLLLEHGADPNVRSGDRPLISAVIDSPELVEILLEHKADPKATGGANDSKWTPLHFWVASTSDHTNTAGILVQHGANVNAIDAGGDTPLHLAVRGGDAVAAATLLALKADPNIRNRNGETPLELAGRSASRPGQVGILNLAGPRPPVPVSSRSPNSIEELLRRHGARELPAFDQIVLQRPETGAKMSSFTKQDPDWNRYSLFEALALQFRLLSRDAPVETGIPDYRSNPLRFPELRRVAIRRADSEYHWKTNHLDVESLLRTGACDPGSVAGLGRCDRSA